MPLLTLQDEVDVYIPDPVSENDEQILRRYYFDSEARQRLRNDLKITPAGALGVAVLVFMTTVTVTYSSSNRLQYWIMSAVIQVFVMAGVLLIVYRYKRARRVLDTLDTCIPVSVHGTNTVDLNAVNAPINVKGQMHLLVPLPRLFRVVDRLYDLPESLSDLLRSGGYPLIDRAVASYVKATREPFEQLMSTDTPSLEDVERARHAIDDKIHEAALYIEWLYRDYRDWLLTQG